uniref:Queuosine 5'-phosphate N-glycosylase/hydrolase n=1 Tax=Trichuris muris TaxID=70415 RepID=A0A5S6R3Q3_TRIMR
MSRTTLRLFDSATLPPRSSGSFIAERSDHVRILPRGIRRVAELVCDAAKTGELGQNLWLNCEAHPKLDGQSAVDWCFVVSVINFSFWTKPRFTVRQNGATLHGYLAFCCVLKRCLEAGIPVTTPAYLAKVSYNDFCNLLRDDNGNVLPLMKLRWQLLQRCSQILLEEFDGTFLTCVKRCNNSAVELMKIVLERFLCFNDVALYKGTKVSFLKRVQILVADIYSSLQGEEPAAFKDIDQLTMFADYRVPQLLVYFGALEYSPALSTLLAKRHVFAFGDSMEVEIRGCAIEAVEKILEESRRLCEANGVKCTLNAIVVDYFLWTYCSDHRYEILSSALFHRCRSMFY